MTTVLANDPSRGGCPKIVGSASPIAADDQIARSASGGMDLDLRDAIFEAPVVEISGF